MLKNMDNSIVYFNFSNIDILEDFYCFEIDDVLMKTKNIMYREMEKVLQTSVIRARNLIIL